MPCYVQYSTAAHNVLLCCCAAGSCSTLFMHLSLWVLVTRSPVTRHRYRVHMYEYVNVLNLCSWTVRGNSLLATTRPNANENGKTLGAARLTARPVWIRQWRMLRRLNGAAMQRKALGKLFSPCLQTASTFRDQSRRQCTKRSPRQMQGPRSVSKCNQSKDVYGRQTRR